MKFVCERIPKECREYFSELDKKVSQFRGRSGSWSVNEDRSVWVRKYYEVSDHTAAGGGYTGLSGWHFYWHGELMLIDLQYVDGGGGLNDDHGWAVYRLEKIQVPDSIENQKTELFRDLELALSEYSKEFDASSPKSYNFSLQYSEEG